MIYIVFTFFLFALGYKLSLKKNVFNRNIYYFVLFMLFIISAFRYQVGCDWDGNIFMYLNSSDISISDIVERRDKLSWAILIFLQEMDLIYPFINIITSAIFFIGIHTLAQRQPDPLTFLILLFPVLIIAMPMSGIRQAAAIGLICIAFVSFIDRRPIRFVIWVTIATGLHGSAIVFLLMLPFSTGRYTIERFFLVFMIVVFALIFYIPNSDSFNSASRIYIGESRYGVDADGAKYRTSFLALSAIYFFFFLKKKWRKTFPSDYNLINLGALGMLMIPALLPLSTVIADRFGYYFIPFQIMIFARIYHIQFKSSNLFYSLLPYVLVFIFFLSWTQLSFIFEYCYVPYKTWFFGLPEANVPGPRMPYGEFFRGPTN